jgi:hypothetical protein
MTEAEVLARVMQKVTVTGGCWVYRGALTPKGYGRTNLRRRSIPTHRFVYSMLVGPVPDDLTIDHLCRNRACCNPAHLEPVTNRENVLRGVGPTAKNARKTHCIRGHEFTPENTYGYEGYPGRGCRICRRASDAASRARRRALLARGLDPSRPTGRPKAAVHAPQQSP